MARAASRDEIAQLVSEHHASVYRYAFRLCGSEADAEDFAQEAFLFAHERLGQLRDASKARPWLLAIVRNCFRKKLRRRSPVTYVDFELDNLAADAPDSPFDLERLQAAIDDLPDEFRLVLLMHYFEFLPYRQIAEDLNVPIGTVMSRLARAKQRLRQAMSRPLSTLPHRHEAPEKTESNPALP